MSEQSRLNDLPYDLRVHCLQGLPLRSLAAVEAVSSAMKAAVGEDSLWQHASLAMGLSLQPSSFARTHRQCLLTSNGWIHLSQVPRRCILAANGSSSNAAGSRRGTRESSSLPVISSWDADDARVVSCGGT